ncbi:FMN-binding negative transcriptional regulator [Paenibacillus sp. HWE-109]|uniref:FMN-binding negative transcriptional regulator n=1 Tax=Paenibacillus sp. HWE-109 TaxID=1306526 RepID=UPI001EDD424B|nr:FMN-binding negative transcriptional regulator [Paenibacillus sp. HWE-109]UKS27944.1 FMN-binding negative transcriptional regulator [Paenibacillus sp. HWE-109]
MYTPKAFEMNDLSTIVKFIREHSFGILFSQHGKEPFATHLPFLLDEHKYEQGVLISHMAKANPHWKDLDNKEVLVVFSGPHAYISPSWYEEPNHAPTWNYISVHVYGKFRRIENSDQIKEIISNTVQYYESPLPDPWTVNYDNKFINGLMNGLIAFEIKIDKLEGTCKLSQNHSTLKQKRLVRGLKSFNQNDSYEIGRIIEKRLTQGDILE